MDPTPEQLFKINEWLANQLEGKCPFCHWHQFSTAQILFIPYYDEPNGSSQEREAVVRMYCAQCFYKIEFLAEPLIDQKL